MISGFRTTQDVDAMWEADAAAEWERINAPDPNEKHYLDAASSLSVAINHMDKALDYLDDAANEVEGLPAEDRIRSLFNELEEIYDSIKSLQNQLRKGWYE